MSTAVAKNLTSSNGIRSARPLSDSLRGRPKFCSSNALRNSGPTGSSSSSATIFMPALNAWPRSEEHTSELQSQSNLVCRLLLEKKKQRQRNLRLRQIKIQPAIRHGDMYDR